MIPDRDVFLCEPQAKSETTKRYQYATFFPLSRASLKPNRLQVPANFRITNLPRARSPVRTTLSPPPPTCTPTLHCGQGTAAHGSPKAPDRQGRDPESPAPAPAALVLSSRRRAPGLDRKSVV